MWAFTLLWNPLSAPVLFFVPGEVAAGNLPALAGVPFPAVGVYLPLLAWRRSREWRRYGPTPLTLDPYPGAIGGPWRQEEQRAGLAAWTAAASGR